MILKLEYVSLMLQNKSAKGNSTIMMCKAIWEKFVTVVKVVKNKFSQANV